MPKLKEYDFYYGAVLNMIFRYNKDAMTSIVETTDYKQTYRLTTNKSKQDFIILIKKASVNQRIKNNDYKSWQFKLTPTDKKCIEEYYNLHFPIFIFFVCLSDNLNDSEILIANYEEIKNVIDKNGINIGVRNNENCFTLFVDKSRSNAMRIPRNRIEKSFDEIVDNVVQLNPSHYCPNCKILLPNFK